MSQIQAKWDAERAATQAAQAEQVMKARQQELALQAAINRIKQEKHREAVKLANDFAAVVDSLHNRPEAGASGGGVPEGAGAGTDAAGWCTGARLYRDHATAFAGQAALAAELQSALRACITHAAEVERELNRSTP
jgi:hypothetical protein